jgi:iron complex transport system substrate-binding protein
VWQVDGVAWSLSGGMLGANLMLDDVARVAAAQVAS